MSIKKNYLYNLLYQVMVMLLPLITVPYISRVLKPHGVGVFAYTSSIVQYFVLIGMLGIGTYGNKLIAMTRDDKKLVSENFLNVYALQLIISLTSVVSYLLLVIFFIHEDKYIAFIQVITLLATIFDCTWFFSGLELFKKIVLRNTIVKLVALIAIFVFVKNPSDLDLYTYIIGLSVLVGQLVMWFYIKEYVIFTKISYKSVIKHLKPTIIYFLPQVAAQVYFVLDKTMIGLLSTKSEVGLYEYADKMQKMALAVVTSLGIVMLPRMANTFVKGELNKARDYIIKSLDFSTLLAIPIMFGLAGISNEFVPWYMGNDFTGCIIILIIISPTIFLMAWSGVFGSQYLVPLGRMKEYTTSLYMGAIINLIINLALIKPYGAIGAAIGTLGAELFVTLTQMYFIRKDIKLKSIVSKMMIYVVAGLIMFLVVRSIGHFMGISVITTMAQVTIGAITYIIIVLISEEYLLKDGLILNELRKRGKIKQEI